jgi:hypothetical protein
MKAKLIHLPDEVFKTLSKNAIDRGTNLKNLIEGILKNYARFVDKQSQAPVASGERDHKFPVREPADG